MSNKKLQLIAYKQTKLIIPSLLKGGGGEFFVFLFYNYFLNK